MIFLLKEYIISFNIYGKSEKMKNSVTKILAVVLATMMFLAPMPSARNSFGISASAVEVVENVEAQTASRAVVETAKGTEGISESNEVTGPLRAIVNFIKDIAAIINAAIAFLEKYGIIKK